jgi:glucokinase
MVVLGGGLVDTMPELFLKEVGEGIRRNTIPEVRGAVRIRVSRLKDLSVASGAAKMACDRLLADAPSKDRNDRVPKV